MAFDFGLRQIGVAVGNRLLCTAQPLPVVRARDGTPDWETVGRLIAEWDPALLVVGDPLNIPFSNLLNFQAVASQSGCRQVVGNPKQFPGGAQSNNGRLLDPNVRLYHPFTCQVWRSELAAASWNFLQLLVLFSGDSDDDGFRQAKDIEEFDPSRPF